MSESEGRLHGTVTDSATRTVTPSQASDSEVTAVTSPIMGSWAHCQWHLLRAGPAQGRGPLRQAGLPARPAGGGRVPSPS